MSRRLVILFAKAPDPGRVKTRLIPRLGPARAAALHRACVEDLLEAMSGFPLELHTDQPGWGDFPAQRPQCEGALGRRMIHAASAALENHDAVCILGADAPTLPPSYVDALFSLDADVALGPAEDGGYWGICFHRTHPAMFDGVEWSTARTLEQSAGAIERAGLSPALGPPWWDVDEPADLDRLLAAGNLPPNLARWANPR